jgi:hypothetical protein
MTITRTLCIALLAASLGLVLASCARDTADAGVKPIGVGFDPGDLFPGPEQRGGLIDIGQYNTRGTNLDFGVTGFFGSVDAFMDPEADPFDALLGWGWLFSPAIRAADEYSALSPKGPDLPDECFVQRDTNGPLGSFRTVDVGDEITFVNNQARLDPNYDEDDADTWVPDTEFVLPRNPQDYPVNTSSVFIYYVGTAPLREGDALLPDNWSYGQNVELQFTGSLPPETAPVPSIPVPSDAADDRANKDAGHPYVFTPDELMGVRVSNRVDDQGSVPVRYDAASDGLPNPLGNDGVLHVVWDEPVTSDSPTLVTVTVLLLREDEPYLIADAFGNPDFCIAAEPLDPEPYGGRTDAWLAEYDFRKGYWCDDEFEPDLELSNDEFGLDLEGEDTCHNGIDDNADGWCDEGGCEDAEGTWLYPDPNCGRHTLQTATCGADNHCRHVGGDRSAEGHIAELVCSAYDDGDFVVPADQVDALMEMVGDELIVGAVLKVARTSEVLVDLPMVRDGLGNEENINPVRLRASQVHFGRFDWE